MDVLASKPTNTARKGPTLFMLHWSLVAILTLTAGISPALAQEADAPDLALGESEEYGPYLTDAEGRSLYLFTDDEGADGSACYGNCAQNWIPLTVDGDPAVGEGLDPELVGTVERDDGATQMTYAGWPLYTYVRDSEPGETLGHGIGNRLYLVSPEGAPAEGQSSAAAATVDDDTMAELVSEGERVFANNCAACHGAEGQGGVGPRLDGYSYLERTSSVINTILTGRPEHGMPPFDGLLDDREVAAVATYIRNAWSNDFGPVSEEEVTEVR